LNRPAALREAVKRGVRLQSLAEAVAARFGGLERSAEYQVVSTLALYFRDEEKNFAVAFAEVPMSEAGLALMHSGYGVHCDPVGFREFVVPACHVLVAGLLSVARCEGRVASVLDRVDSLRLSTVQEAGMSEYARHPYVQALFGSSALAEMNAECIRQRKRESGYVWFVSRNHLEEQISKDNVLVRPVGLGGNGFGDIDLGVNAGYGFYYDGRARGVAPSAKNFPQEMKVNFF
jgi:hypothetical protein